MADERPPGTAGPNTTGTAGPNTGRDHASAGEQLRTLRLDLHMSREELAALAGVEEEDLAAMEDGRVAVPADLMSELLEELNAKGA